MYFAQIKKKLSKKLYLFNITIRTPVIEEQIKQTIIRLLSPFRI